MTSDEIDAQILACLSTRWQKVAMVIGAVGQSISSPGRDDEFDRVAKRIYALGRASRVAAVGDVRHWRESEIRLP